MTDSRDLTRNRVQPSAANDAVLEIDSNDAMREQSIQVVRTLRRVVGLRTLEVYREWQVDRRGDPPHDEVERVQRHHLTVGIRPAPPPPTSCR